MMQRGQCPICTSKEYAIIREAAHQRVIRCQSCHYIYRDPAMPAPAEPTGSLHHVPDYLYLRRLHVLQRLCEPGRLLEIGARSPQFCTLAREQGWQAVATRLGYIGDAAPDAPELREGLFPAGSFDAVTLCGVLDEYPWPTELLRVAAHYCRIDGLLLVETWDGDHAEVHEAGHLPPRLFSSSALHSLLERFGFRMERAAFLPPPSAQAVADAVIVAVARYVP